MILREPRRDGQFPHETSDVGPRRAEEAYRPHVSGSGGVLEQRERMTTIIAIDRGRSVVVHPTDEVDLATQYFGLRRDARDDLRGRRVEEQHLHAATSTVAGREAVDVGPDRCDAVELLLVRHFASLEERRESMRLPAWEDDDHEETYRTMMEVTRSRFKLNVSAGSQKRTIHKSEGRNESRFSSISKNSKRNLNVTIVKYILSLFGQIVSLFGQTNCVGLRTLCQKRLLGKKVPLVGSPAQHNHNIHYLLSHYNAHNIDITRNTRCIRFGYA